MRLKITGMDRFSPSSFQRRLESRKAGRSAKGWQGLPDARVRLSCRCIVIPAMREWLVKPLDSGLRRAATGILSGLFQTCLRQAAAETMI